MPLIPQPMIVVHDVEATSAWYQRVLGLRSGHGGPEYEMLMSGDQLVLQLHRWEAHEHPHLGEPDLRPYGNGALLWFETDEFDAALQRIRQAEAMVLEGPLVNPNAQHREIWLRDPNGYKVVVASPYGDLAPARGSA
jgi:catechol 2,3-dioxygenase-like lactoylglutathione lyase family enzyme